MNNFHSAGQNTRAREKKLRPMTPIVARRACGQTFKQLIRFPERRSHATISFKPVGYNKVDCVRGYAHRLSCDCFGNGWPIDAL